MNVKTESIFCFLYADDMKCMLFLENRQFHHFKGVMLNESRAILSETGENAFLKQTLASLDDQNEHSYDECLIYCRQSSNRLTLNFEIVHLDLQNLDLPPFPKF